MESAAVIEADGARMFVFFDLGFLGVLCASRSVRVSRTRVREEAQGEGGRVRSKRGLNLLSSATWPLET